MTATPDPSHPPGQLDPTAALTHEPLGGMVTEEPIAISDPHAPKDIVAEAISRYWTVRVGVDSDGYAAQVTLTDAARNWDSERLSQAIMQVAAVAHDRYAALTDTADAAALEIEVAFGGRDLFDGEPHPGQ